MYCITTRHGLRIEGIETIQQAYAIVRALELEGYQLLHI